MSVRNQITAHIHAYNHSTTAEYDSERSIHDDEDAEYPPILWNNSHACTLLCMSFDLRPIGRRR